MYLAFYSSRVIFELFESFNYRKKKHKTAVPDGAKKDDRTKKSKGRHGDGVLVGKSHNMKEKSSNTKNKPDKENVSESTNSSSSDESSKSVQR